MNCMPLCVEIAASRFVSVSDLTAVVKLDYNVTTINKEDMIDMTGAISIRPSNLTMSGI